MSYKIKIDVGFIRRHIDQIRLHQPLSVNPTTDLPNFGSPVELAIPAHENPVTPQIEQGTQQPLS